MLSAKLDGEPILLHEPTWNDREEWLRQAARAGRLLAPCCGAPLVLKWGERKQRHFAHPRRVQCEYERWTEPESPEHMAGKILLHEWCRRALGDRLRFLALEHPLPGSQQRPDVYLELDDGARYAFEYQRSVITPGEWAERHAGYQQQGIHDIWILGENRLADALPKPEQQERWAKREPHMHFLKLRAFEGALAAQTPYEIAWWRGEQQEELWAPQELDARVGREVFPWYRRSALERLGSVTFLDAGTGAVRIYRAMRELPGHTDTRIASVVLEASLADAGLELTPGGLVTAKDRERLERHRGRVERLESQLKRHAPPPVSVTEYRFEPSADLVAEEPVDWGLVSAARHSRVWPPGVDVQLFLLGEQEAEQQRRLQERAAVPEWRRIVDRHGLRPENLHFLVGAPIPDDTVFLVHRTVWQAYLYYTVVRELRGPLRAPRLAALLGRKFGLHEQMAAVARYRLPGEVNSPERVVGLWLNLLVDCGYLRNDMASELFLYHPAKESAPPLAFVDRSQRRAAWSGLLSRQLRLNWAAPALEGAGGRIGLVPVALEDRPTQAQVAAVAAIARGRGLAVDLQALTYTQAGRIIARARANRANENPDDLP